MFITLLHVAKENVLSLQEQIMRTRGVRMGVFLCPHSHHCVRVPAILGLYRTFSLNFQDQNHFPGFFRPKILQKISRTFQEAWEPWTTSLMQTQLTSERNPWKDKYSPVQRRKLSIHTVQTRMIDVIPRSSHRAACFHVSSCQSSCWNTSFRCSSWISW